MNRKPLAPHGTYARFVGRPGAPAPIPGCRCKSCKSAGAAYCARRYLMTATGRQLTVDPARAAAHVEMLLAGGASWTTLKAAGCDNQTVRRLLNRTGGPIHRRTENKILAIRLQDVLSPHRRLPAAGSVRRIQALVAIGHTLTGLAKACDCSRSQLYRLIVGELPDVSAAEAQRITNAYTVLARTPGTSARSRMRAKRAGWAGPMEWGPDIDDPTAQPEPEPAEPARSKGELARERAAEVAHLAQYGETIEGIAARTGLSVSYVRELLAGRRGPGWRVAA